MTSRVVMPCCFNQRNPCCDANPCHKSIESCALRGFVSMAAASTKEGKKHKVECIGCGTMVDDDHTGVRCANSHHICPECTPNFVTVVFENWGNYKCLHCNADIIAPSFERQLSESQRLTFLRVMADRDRLKGEHVHHCPFCPYFVIYTDEHVPNFFFCEREACGRASCGHCLRETYRMEDDLSPDAYEERLADPERGMMAHFECAELAEPLKQVMNALGEAESIRCPGCNAQGGMKDDACTHMRCEACQVRWCYVCQKTIGDCAGATETDFGHHNIGWQHDASRCPWWLEEISGTDDSWPIDKTEALAYFHHERGRRLLRRQIDAMGLDMFHRLREKYGAVAHCGFTVDEITAVPSDAPLFDRA